MSSTLSQFPENRELRAILPAELWDLILTKLMEIDVRKVAIFKLFSKYFNSLILNNKNIKYKLFLFQNGALHRELPAAHRMARDESYWMHCEATRGVIDPKRSKLIFVFIWIVSIGDLEILKWAYLTFKLTPKDIKIRQEYILQQATKYGQLEILQWLDSILDLGNISYKYTRLLILACEYGHLEIVKWLVNAFNLTIKDNFFCGRNETLFRACVNGHLEVAKWLAEHYNLEIKDVLSACDDVLKVTCENGYLEVAEWLTEKFGLTTENFESQITDSFVENCGYGNLKAIKWLAKKFNLNHESAYYQDGCALKLAAKHGHLEVVRWLVATFNLTSEKARKNTIVALHVAIEHQHPIVADWLTTVLEY